MPPSGLTNQIRVVHPLEVHICLSLRLEGFPYHHSDYRKDMFFKRLSHRGQYKSRVCLSVLLNDIYQMKQTVVVIQDYCLLFHNKVISM